MRKSKLFYVLGFILIFVLVLPACSKNDKADYGGPNYESNYDRTESTAEPQSESPSEGKTSFTDSGGVSNSATIVTEKPKVQSQDKIIRRFYLDVETQEFDSLIRKIDTEINRLGGYVENSEISGKRFYYNNEARYGNIIVRIPIDSVDEFVNAVNDNANVVNKEESTQNVTLAYIDTESRKKSLEIEQERLFVLLEKTDTLENIIALESRLSSIRYELQSYETQLRTYDNQVEYSTVTLNIQEVERITPVIELKQTVGNRIQNGFSNTMYNLSEGFKNFFVWFVVNIPYLIIWAVIITSGVLIVRRYMKKKEKNNLPPPQGPNQNV